MPLSNPWAQTGKKQFRLAHDLICLSEGLSSGPGSAARLPCCVGKHLCLFPNVRDEFELPFQRPLNYVDADFQIRAEHGFGRCLLPVLAILALSLGSIWPCLPSSCLSLPF